MEFSQEQIIPRRNLPMTKASTNGMQVMPAKISDAPKNIKYISLNYLRFTFCLYISSHKAVSWIPPFRPKAQLH